MTANLSHSLPEGCSITWGGDAAFSNIKGTTATATFNTVGTGLRITAGTICQREIASSPFNVVEVASVTCSSDSACVGCNVTFTVTTNPSGYGNLISWSGGGNPSTGSGSTFTTNWSTAGTKTVTATCGSSSKSKQVTIVEVASVSSDKDEACDGENVMFEVTTSPPGFGSIVSWSGGGTPANGYGSTFTTYWSTGGTKTVTATCGTSSKYKQVAILAGCDCTETGSWVSFIPISNCDLYNGPADEEERPDNCKNTIKQDCSGGSGSYAFHWYYNGSNVGTCIWHNGYNEFEYRLTINGYRYHSTRHSTLHQCNSTSCPKYPTGRYGCANSGYYCWEVTYNNCINGGSPPPIWRRSTSYPTSIWDDDGVDCPDGEHH